MMLKVGTFIAIAKDSAEDNGKYKSRVIDSGEGFVMIDYPTHIETGRTAFFMDDTRLLISFTDDLKVSYAFETVVSGRLNKGVPMLKLAYPGDDGLVKIQRREFVRVETALEVTVEKGDFTIQLVTKDISAGGMALNLPNPQLFAEGETVELMIVLPFAKAETRYVQAQGEIVRIWEKSKRMIASISFIDIRDDDRQGIIRYCFERQLRIRNG